MGAFETTKSFLIYIPPSEEISYLLEKVSTKLRENHPSNTYIPLYKDKWHSHLMLYLSPMPKENQVKIIETVSKVSKELPSFKVELSYTELSEANYIYVGVNNEAKNILEKIHNQLVISLAPFRDETIKEKYLQKWDSFSEEERLRIKTTGLPYIYVPHITLGIFGSRKEQEQAYKEILSFNLMGNSFIADKIEILTSDKSGYKGKEIIFSETFQQ